MASLVVLVRHGKAQARQEGVDDFGRKLTEAGRRALASTLPDTLAPLGTMPEYLYGTTEIWSSEAVRAMESAEEVAFVLGVSEIKTHNCLFEQHVERFLQEAREAEADVVVAVGHNPFIEQVASVLCGGTVPFKTGSLGIFDITAYDGVAYDGTLRSFSQGPRTDNWKTLVKVERILSDSAKKVQTNMDAFLEAPEDVEALHDFRVSIRTLRSELAFVEPFQRKSQNKFLQTSLRDLVVTTSRLRELDVLTDTIGQSDYASEELSKACSKMRRKECAKLLFLIGNKKARKSTAKLLKRFDDIEWRKDIERFGLSRNQVASNFDLMVMEFEANYLATDYRDVNATHKLRKDAKRVRYTSREFGDIIGDAAEGMPAAMEQVQDELGALCDARVNCDLIDSMPSKKLSKKAKAALKALRQEQLDAIEAILQANAANETEAAEDIATEIETVVKEVPEVCFDEPEALVADIEDEPEAKSAPASEAVDILYDVPEALVADIEILPELKANVAPEAADTLSDVPEAKGEPASNKIDIHYDEPEALVADIEDEPEAKSAPDPEAVDILYDVPEAFAAEDEVDPGDVD